MEIGWVLIVKCLKSSQETKNQFSKTILIPFPSGIPHWNFTWRKVSTHLLFCEALLDFLITIKNNFYWK